ncbi:hypothetical protein C0Q70_20981 [Pomacea canaliculata]|uniref:Uncharacterized protein n=2 Tax=Pomacea canaliculata TaxID=400727 RepID=A0A2T7NBA9_POMCA|nr:hypothetical protein C0Q70_20981 [Pomacea canaliculata]
MIRVDENTVFLREGTSGKTWMAGMNAHKEPNTQTCEHPVLDPFDPSIMQFHEKYSPVNCSQAEEDWVYTINGTFRISKHALRLPGTITCEYIPLERHGDFSVREGLHVNPMLDGAPLTTDFFMVYCESSTGKRYLNIHSGVVRNKDVFSRLETLGSISSIPMMTPPSTHTSKQESVPLSLSLISKSLASLNLNVFMFGFDSMSRMSWIRLLPRTRRYFLETLGGLELEGYNIVGDGTPAALLPILTGHHEEELPEARRGMPGAQPVDGHPWVWKEFKRHGYVTAYAEDMTNVGTFQFRMLGFKEQPTDHYMRPFYQEAEKMYETNIPYCLGSTPRHLNFMHWFEELFATYTRHPKFFFGFHSELSHNSNFPVQALDEDLVLFLDRLEKSGHLNSTLLILMADHGARFSYIRATTQGKLEERMPYFALRFRHG